MRWIDYRIGASCPDTSGAKGETRKGASRPGGTLSLAAAQREAPATLFPLSLSLHRDAPPKRHSQGLYYISQEGGGQGQVAGNNGQSSSLSLCRHPLDEGERGEVTTWHEQEGPLDGQIEPTRVDDGIC